MYFEYETEEHCIQCGKPKDDGHAYCKDCEDEETIYLNTLGIH